MTLVNLSFQGLAYFQNIPTQEILTDFAHAFDFQPAVSIQKKMKMHLLISSKTLSHCLWLVFWVCNLDVKDDITPLDDVIAAAQSGWPPQGKL